MWFLVALVVFGCWFLLLLWYPWGSVAAGILFVIGAGSLLYAVDKKDAERQAECRAAGGEPIKGRDFYACLAKGTILRP
jgi:hypothetical protein